jgi:hypothetical protein
MAGEECGFRGLERMEAMDGCLSRCCSTRFDDCACCNSIARRRRIPSNRFHRILGTSSTQLIPGCHVHLQHNSLSSNSIPSIFLQHRLRIKCPSINLPLPTRHPPTSNHPFSKSLPTILSLRLAIHSRHHPHCNSQCHTVRPTHSLT